MFKISEKHLFYLLILLHLIYLWIIPVFLTQDGPSHLYNSVLLWHYNDSDFYRAFFDLNLKLFPNWTTNIIIAPLLLIFKPVIADKIFISLLFTGIPISFRYALSCIHPKAVFLSVFAFIFTNSYFLVYGFYNFQLSIIFFFLFIALYQRYKKKKSLSVTTALSILLVLTFFTHPVALIVLIVYTCIETFFSIVSHRRKKEGPFSSILAAAFMLLPAMTVFIIYLMDQPAGTGPVYEFKVNAHYFSQLFSLGHLSVFADCERFVFILFTLLFFLIIFLCILRFERDEYSESVMPLFFTLLFCLGVYFFISDQLAGGAYLSARILIFVYLLVLLLAANLLAELRWKKLFVISAIAGTILILAIRFPYQETIGKNLKSYLALADSIPSNSTLLPLGFSNNGQEGSRGYSPKIALYRHISGYVAAGREIVSFDNYEANTAYFPILWKDELNPYKLISKEKEDGIETNPPSVDLHNYPGSVDFILLYGNPWPYKDSDDFKELCSQLHEQYNFVCASSDGISRLYKKKQTSN